jgi:hypothetical protein
MAVVVEQAVDVAAAVHDVDHVLAAAPVAAGSAAATSAVGIDQRV